MEKFKKRRRPFKMVPAVFCHSLTISVWNTAVQKVKNCKARIIPPSRFWPDSVAYQYRSPPTKAALLREPYDLTQIVRNESVPISRFCAMRKMLVRRTCGRASAAVSGSETGLFHRHAFGQIPGLINIAAALESPHNRQRAARAPRPKRAVQPGGSPAQL